MRPESARWGGKRRARAPQSAAILWLGVVLLILLSLLLLSLYAGMSNDCSRLRAAVVAAQVVGAEPAALEELWALRSAAVESAADETTLLRAASGGIAWTALLEHILPPAQAGVHLLSFEQHGAEIQLQAEADGEAALLAYVQRLRASTFFLSVEFERGLAAGSPAAFTVTLHLRAYNP